MLRGIGAAAVVLACTALGFRVSRELSCRVKSLRELERLMLMLSGEIQYAKTPLNEAMCELSRRAQGAFGPFFGEAAASMEQREKGIADIFRENAQLYLRESGLLKKDIEQLERLGGRLGYLDREMQVQTILLYRRELEQERTEAEEDYRQKGRVYRCLGFLGGCFLILLLV